jgi:putative membrane protein
MEECMKQLSVVGVFACAMALAAPAQAQTAKPDPAKPPVQTPAAKSAAAATVGATDKTFATTAARDGMAEVEHGRLAAEKATNADVKQFGQRMVDDHGKANDELKSWASANSVTLPTDMGTQHKAMQDKLSKLSGDAFDRAYMAHMVTAHGKAVTSFTRASKTARNADLKAWAGKTLPTLEEHHKLARTINTKLAGAKTTTLPK